MIALRGNVTEQRWCKSHRYDPAARRLADRHYSRQKVGSPQFVKAGSNVVFLTDCGRAFWVTSAPLAEFTHHEWAGAWECAAFRSEGAGIASELIRQGIAATRAHYGDPPPLGMVTFIDRDKVRPTINLRTGEKIFGYCFRKAGFVEAGETKVHKLLCLRLAPSDMPGPFAARPRAMHGAPLFDGAMA